MSNNYINHNDPEYSGNHDPDPSSCDLSGTSDDDNLEPTISTPEDPYVSRYGMADTKNNLHDAELYRATLFNLKTEPIEDREEHNHESNSIFLQECGEPEEINLIDELVEDVQPKETILKIKSEPIDEIEDDTSLLCVETEPHDYLPEIYSESTEDSFHIDTTNPGVNELESNRMFLQQSREPEEEILETDKIPIENSSHIDTVNPRGNELESNKMFLQQHREKEEELDNDKQLVVPLEPEEINETNTQLVEPEAIDKLNIMTEIPSPIDSTTNPRASDLDNGNANINENPASVPSKTRKKKDVIATPNRVSIRIKKPKIMYNI